VIVMTAKEPIPPGSDRIFDALEQIHGVGAYL
jgi:hypothetical protein